MHDLSIVTDALRKVLTDALATSPVWGGSPPPFSVNVSGQHPETPSGGSDCELSLYLFHVGADKYLANSFWSQSAQHTGKAPVGFEPLSLDLWYMLSAQSQASYVHEQQVLSVAMQAFHDHATVQIPSPAPLPPVLPLPPQPPPPPVPTTEATLVLESPTFDEMSRLWQAIGLPLRTTAQYRVSVVFLTPDAKPPLPFQVESANLVGAPTDPVLDPTEPRLFATRRTVSYVAPGPATTIFQQSPATTAPAPAAFGGQTIVLDGEHLEPTDHVLLVSYSASGVPSETDVTSTWQAAPGVPFRLRPPEGAGAPKPGRYELAISRPTKPGWRSNGVPLDVAAWINPTGGPLLTDDAGVYTIEARNVPTTGAILRFGSTALTRIAAGSTPDPGEWQSSGGGSQITFAAPDGTPPGRHQIGLRVADIEADPALWAVV
jgi:Pvc16 N-terminal domain